MGTRVSPNTILLIYHLGLQSLELTELGGSERLVHYHTKILKEENLSPKTVTPRFAPPNMCTSTAFCSNPPLAVREEKDVTIGKMILVCQNQRHKTPTKLFHVSMYLHKHQLHYTEAPRHDVDHPGFQKRMHVHRSTTVRSYVLTPGILHSNLSPIDPPCNVPASLGEFSKYADNTYKQWNRPRYILNPNS